MFAGLCLLVWAGIMRFGLGLIRWLCYFDSFGGLTVLKFVLCRRYVLFGFGAFAMLVGFMLLLIDLFCLYSLFAGWWCFIVV